MFFFFVILGYSVINWLAKNTSREIRKVINWEIMKGKVQKGKPEVISHSTSIPSLWLEASLLFGPWENLFREGYSVLTLLFASGQFSAEKMPVWRESTVRLALQVLAAIGQKVIGTYPGSQVYKTAGHLPNRNRWMGLANSQMPRLGPFSGVTYVTHFHTH